jgi:hypothetical protein
MTMPSWTIAPRLGVWEVHLRELSNTWCAGTCETLYETVKIIVADHLGPCSSLLQNPHCHDASSYSHGNTRRT